MAGDKSNSGNLSNINLGDLLLDKSAVYPQHNFAMNLTRGGQNGFLMRVGAIDKDGKPRQEWISDQSYVSVNIIPVLLTTPLWMDYFEDGIYLKRFYKNLIETHATTIDGLTSTLSIDTVDKPFGNAGETFEQPSNVTRAKSTVTFTFPEKLGRAVQKFFDIYVRYGIMDPDTKKPNIASYLGNTDEPSVIDKIKNLNTVLRYAGSCLFIEPDITHKIVNNAWLCVNFWPKSAGEVTGKMDKRSGGETKEYSIEFSSITMNNEATLRFAEKILSRLTIIDAIPDMDLLLPLDDVDSSLTSDAFSNVGYDKWEDNHMKYVSQPNNDAYEQRDPNAQDLGDSATLNSGVDS